MRRIALCRRFLLSFTILCRIHRKQSIARWTLKVRRFAGAWVVQTAVVQYFSLWLASSIAQELLAGSLTLLLLRNEALMMLSGSETTSKMHSVT